MQQVIIKEPILAPSGEKQSQYLCPDCLGSAYFRRRSGWTDHYCHKPNSVCSTKLIISRVSFEHELGKKLLSDRLSQLFPDAEIKIEYGVDERKRIADVAAVKDSTILAAYECQISPILVRGERGLEERTRDYLDTGVPVTWWFGERSLTSTIRNWCVEFFGKGSWEVIDHPQVRLEGYVVERKKMMNNFLSNAIIDCLGLDKVDELLKAELQAAVEAGNADAAQRICTTWNELKKRKAVRSRSDLFASDEYWMKFCNQVLYLLWHSNEPKPENEITKCALEMFEFSEEDWVATDLRTIADSTDGAIPHWNWVVGYAVCLGYLIENRLIEWADGDEVNAFLLTPAGRDQVNSMDLSTLPLKNNAVQEESKSAYPLPVPEEPRRKNLLPRNYTEKFIGQVLSLFKEKPMTRKQLYQEAEKKFSFSDEDKVLINEDGGRPFPLWEQVYSRTVDRLIKHNFLEYCESDRHIRANKRCQITQLGIEKLKEFEPEKSKNGSSNGSLLLLT